MQIRRFVRKVNILVIVLPLYQRNVAQQIAIAAHSVCMYDELYEILVRSQWNLSLVTQVMLNQVDIRLRDLNHSIETINLSNKIMNFDRYILVIISNDRRGSSLNIKHC